MRAWSAFRALVRIELRSARRHAARSWLVVALLALCVAAMSGGGAVFATARATPEELRANVLGAAALRVETYDALERREFESLLGGDARCSAFAQRSVTVRAAGGEAQVECWSFERNALEHGQLAEGLLRLLAGRAPHSADECALSPSAARALGVELGADVQLDGRSRELVGLAARPEELGRAVAWVEFDPERATSLWLVDAQPQRVAALADALFARGQRVIRRSELGQRDEFEALVTFVLGGFAFFEAALVIAAVFAVGVRRRQREIGLVGANGATVADVARALCVATVILAGVGVLLGLALGLGAAHALAPWLDGWNGRWNGALELSRAHLLAAALLGPSSALLATLAPAVSAARLPVLVALSGRRPTHTAARGWLVVGATLLLLGGGALAVGTRAEDAAAAASVLGGSIACVLGLGACSPWLLSALAKQAAPLPLAWRLAARDAGRFGARNGPVVTAVLAALSISVLLASLAGSIDALVAQNGAGGAGAERALIDLALVASLATSLIVVFLATALAGVESAADARVLDAVGAAPREQRKLAGARAAYLALLGALLAVPAGLAPSWGLIEFADARLEFHTPWPQLAACVVALPVLAFLGAWFSPVRHTPSMESS